jgi:hypothetical protein
MEGLEIFVKHYELFIIMQETNPVGCKGLTGNDFDRYASMWFQNATEAKSFRNYLNQRIGWPVATKSEFCQ